MMSLGSPPNYLALQRHYEQLKNQQLLNQQQNSLGGYYGLGQSHSSLHNNSLNSSYFSSRLSTIPTPQQGPTTARKIPREGIRAGEITAYRAWKITRDGRYLRSVTVENIWLPESPMEGDINFCLGVHCFNSMAHLDNEIYCDGYMSTLVLGSINIWGEIVEHQKGYRAQFASVRSLDRIINFRRNAMFGYIFGGFRSQRLLNNLRQLYCSKE